MTTPPPTTDRLTRAALIFVMVAALTVGTWSIYTLLTQHFHAPTQVAVFGCAMFDAAALFFARLAQRYATSEDSGFAPRLAMLATVSASSWTNWTHAQMEGWGTVGGVVLGAAPVIAEVAFELYHRYVHRDALRRRGRVAAALPVFGKWAWLMYLPTSFRAMRKVVGYQLTKAAATDSTEHTVERADTFTATMPTTPGTYAFTLSPDGLQPVPLSAILPPDTVRPVRTRTVRQSGPPARPVRPEGTVLGDVADIYGRAHAPVVYFIRNGERVKIGTSQNLRRRVEALCLRTEDVLLVLHGDQRYEREMHVRFASVRIGNTEWFERSGELAEFIATRAGTVRPPDEPTPDASREPVRTDVAEEHAPAREVPMIPPVSARPDKPGPDSPLSAGQGADTLAGLVRGLLDGGVADSKTIVAEAVSRFGPDTKADSVRRLIRRHRADKKPTEPGTGQYL